MDVWLPSDVAFQGLGNPGGGASLGEEIIIFFLFWLMRPLFPDPDRIHAPCSGSAES